jgi:hypothetical protein
MGEVGACFAALAENETVETVEVKELDMGNGCAEVALSLKPSLYFDVLSELAGEEIRDEGALFALVETLSATREKYEKVREALESVEKTGYGIVMPRVEDLTLEKPTIIKQSGGFGVRMASFREECRNPISLNNIERHSVFFHFVRIQLLHRRDEFEVACRVKNVFCPTVNSKLHAAVIFIRYNIADLPNTRYIAPIPLHHAHLISLAEQAARVVFGVGAD